MMVIRASALQILRRRPSRLYPSSTVRSRIQPNRPRRRRLTTLPSNKPDKAPTPAEQATLDFLADRGRALGMRLSLSERQLIAKEVGQKDGKLNYADWKRLLSRHSLRSQERLTLSDYLAKSHDGYLGQNLLKWTSRCGIAFLALTSAHTAGEAGMHAFGSTLIGCIASLGGGTFNQIVTGTIPVGWARDPSFLLITVGASLVGFYVWPLAEQLFLNEDNDTNDGNHRRETKDVDLNNDSALRYALESVALGSLAVVGAQGGIVAGLHPIVSATLGVTIALGGVVRDVMCGRDLTLGASTGCQSYGIASLAGSSVYVALRELHVWNCAGSTAKLVKGGIPIGLRILLGFGTVFGVRAVAWQYKPDGLLLTMEESAQANQKRIQKLLGSLS